MISFILGLLYSVMQSDRNSFCDTVVMAFRDADNLFDQIYKEQLNSDVFLEDFDDLKWIKKISITVIKSTFYIKELIKSGSSANLMLICVFQYYVLWENRITMIIIQTFLLFIIFDSKCCIYIPGCNVNAFQDDITAKKKLLCSDWITPPFLLYQGQ